MNVCRMVVGVSQRSQLSRNYIQQKKTIAALKRHLEFFNTHPYVASPVIGVTLALEEDKANGAPVEDSAIQGVKVGMMGPLAGVGDQYSGSQQDLSLEL